MSLSCLDRKYFFLLQVAAVLLLSFLFVAKAHAVRYYWAGSGSNVWENPNHWSTESKGGGTVGTLPGPTDIAVLNYSGAVIEIKSSLTIGGLVMASSFTGSIRVGSGTFAIGGSGVTIGSGRLVSQTTPFSVSGSYTQTGGAVVIRDLSLSGSLTINGRGATKANFTSTGTILFNNDNADQNWVHRGNYLKSYKNITLNTTAGSTSDDVILAGSGLTLSGTITVTRGNLDFATNNINLALSGSITVASNAQSTLTSDVTITMSGSLTTGALGSLSMEGGTLVLDGIEQTIDTNNAPMLNLTIQSGSGTSITDNAKVRGTLTVAAGSKFVTHANILYATGAAITNNGTITEGTGKIVHTGSTFLAAASDYTEQAEFAIGSTVYITLTDSDENIDGTAADTVTVTISAGADSETVTLTETGNATGIFRGSILTQSSSPTASNTLLEGISQQSIGVTYTDAQDGFSNTDAATLTFPSLGSSTTTTTTTVSGGGGGGRRAAVRVQDVIAENPRTAVAAEKKAAAPSQVGGSLPSVRGKLQVTVDEKELVFGDVPADAWFAGFIFNAVKKGIVSGYRDARGRPTGAFGPANNVTFAEIAKMAAQSAGLGESDATPRNRKARGEWSAGFVASMEGKGVSAFADQTLNVNAAAPRGEVIQTILEAFGVDMGEAEGGVYGDVSRGSPNAAAIERATLDGIVSGDDGKDTFRPRAPINRAEVSKMIDRAMAVYGE